MTTPPAKENPPRLVTLSYASASEHESQETRVDVLVDTIALEQHAGLTTLRAGRIRLAIPTAMLKEARARTRNRDPNS